MNTNVRKHSKTLAILSACITAFALAVTMAFALAPADQAYAAPTTSQVYKVGATFTVDGNTYKVTERYKSAFDPGEAVLIKYGSKNTKPTINTVKHQGKLYEVEAIGKNAFSTTQGKKITSVKLGKNVESIGATAFAGCTKLTTIDIAQSDVLDIEYSRRTKSYYVDEIEIGTRAFANAGTKNVTVKCGSNNKSYQAAVKSALVGKGLKTSAKVVR